MFVNSHLNTLVYQLQLYVESIFSQTILKEVTLSATKVDVFVTVLKSYVLLRQHLYLLGLKVCLLILDLKFCTATNSLTLR
jgi:hypothetical protein